MLVSVLLLLFSSSLAPSQMKWSDALRDVYINGVLVHGGQTLVSESPRMIAYVPETGKAIVIEVQSHDVSTVDRSLFALAPDRTTATTSANLPLHPVATAVKPDDTTWLFAVDGASILIHSHQSHAGPMTESDLWKTAPVWREIYEHYTPDAAAVASLRSESSPRRVKIVFATWCGDSKKAVPRLLKSLREAGNANLHVDLVGLGPDFLSPMQEIHDDRLTNVPTIIVYDGKRELGRLVETPATATIESDLASLLKGTLPPHPGRWERTTRIASGKYGLRDAHGAKGTETFELWNTKEGGVLLHSVIDQNGEKIETFASLDGHRHPDFAEVTRTRGKHIVRTRCWENDGQWLAFARGDESGIVEQHGKLPAAMTVPATASLGWPLFTITGIHQEPPLAYVISDDFVGRLKDVSVGPAGSGYLPLRKNPTLRVTTGRGEYYDVEVESALNLPRLVRFADGSERKLISVSGELPRAIPAANGE